MPKFSANLSMLFTERPFVERFDAAAKAGFNAVEYMFPYSENIDEIARILEEYRLTQVLFNLPAGNWSGGDRGIAVDPNRRGEFRRGVGDAIEIARRFRCERLNCLAGKRIESMPLDEQRRVLVENLRFAAQQLGRAGITLLVEPVNTYEIPGFFLSTSAQAVSLFEEIGAPNVRLQYDVYHMQRMEGNLAHTLGRLIGQIGHVHIADSPDRHEPGTGEINFGYLLRRLDALDYEGYVGLEYKPSNTTETSLGWIETLGFRRGG